MGGLFGAKTPTPPPPVRMPVPDDKAAKEAAARAQNELLAARGRQSTNLANDQGGHDKLGQ